MIKYLFILMLAGCGSNCSNSILMGTVRFPGITYTLTSECTYVGAIVKADGTLSCTDSGTYRDNNSGMNAGTVVLTEGANTCEFPMGVPYTYSYAEKNGRITVSYDM